MSDGREQSYYEIALTNRQVMSIFVVLLVCLLAAFVSGVWVGKEGGATTIQTAEAQVITSGFDNGDRPLGQMDFFDPPAGGPGAGEARRAPASGPARPAKSPAAEARGSTAPPSAEAPPAAKTEEPEARKEELVPKVEPAAPSEGPRRADPPPRLAAAGAASPPPAAEIFFIQVFSSNDEAQARSVVDRLRGGGYPGLLSSADIDGRMMYRVRIGPYSERDAARKVAQRVQREYKLSTWITR